MTAAAAAAAAAIDPTCSAGYAVMEEAAVLTDVKFECIREISLLLVVVATVEAAVADDTVVVACCTLEPGS